MNGTNGILGNFAFKRQSQVTVHHAQSEEQRFLVEVRLRDAERR